MTYLTPAGRLQAYIALLLGLVLFTTGTFGQSLPGDPETVEPLPRQVILIIGDGMDEQQITIARNYLKGASGRLLLDQMPLLSSSQVLAIDDQVDGKPVYVADSANTATSMATGEVTSRSRISTSAGSARTTRHHTGCRSGP